MEYLIAVTVKNADGESERSIYRVSQEAPLRDVVRRAIAMASLSDAPLLRLTNLEVLGTLEPHLWSEHRDLMDDVAPEAAAAATQARSRRPVFRGGSS